MKAVAVFVLVAAIACADAGFLRAAPVVLAPAPIAVKTLVAPVPVIRTVAVAPVVPVVKTIAVAPVYKTYAPIAVAAHPIAYGHSHSHYH